jgi:hypothetical protein
MKPATRTKIWRKNNPDKVKSYEKSRYPKTHSRIKARRAVAKSIGESKLKGKSIDHKDGNPNNNSRSNLRIVKKFHKNKKNGAVSKKWK